MKIFNVILKTGASGLICKLVCKFTRNSATEKNSENVETSENRENSSHKKNSMKSNKTKKNKPQSTVIYTSQSSPLWSHSAPSPLFLGPNIDQLCLTPPPNAWKPGFHIGSRELHLRLLHRYPEDDIFLNWPKWNVQKCIRKNQTKRKKSKFKKRSIQLRNPKAANHSMQKKGILLKNFELGSSFLTHFCRFPNHFCTCQGRTDITDTLHFGWLENNIHRWVGRGRYRSGKRLWNCVWADFET